VSALISLLVFSKAILVNAASKGHLPVVLYLLSKQHADPLIRNNWGETAFDIAAAIFEAWICEVCPSYAIKPSLTPLRCCNDSKWSVGTTAMLDTTL
jgi:Ankyrin repeats (many copies)